MDYGDERYVRLFTRDTVTWKRMGWEARTVLMHMFRKVNRVGVVEVGDDGIEGLAALLELPDDLVQRGVDSLVQRRTVIQSVIRGTAAYVIPNFFPAQEAKATDRARKARERETRAAEALLGEVNAAAAAAGVTPRDVTSHDVTERHDSSHDVTSGHSDPIRSDPYRSDVNAAEPRPEPLLSIQESKPKKPRAQPRTQLPMDWQPSASHVEKARTSGLSLDDEAERFRLHHTARATLFSSWDAAFHLWLRNAPGFARTGGGAPGNGSGPASPASPQPPKPKKILDGPNTAP